MKNPRSSLSHAGANVESAPLRALDEVVRTAFPQDAVARLLKSPNEAGNGDWLVAYARDRMLFDHPLKRWRIFDGTIWREDCDEEARRITEEAVRALYQAAATLPTDSALKLAIWTNKSLSRKGLDNMLNIAQFKLSAKDVEFDSDPYVLGVQNGVVDLRTGESRTARQADYLTRSAGTAYDPDAVAPTWDAFIHRVCGGDPELIELLRLAVGYSLTGSTEEQVWFMLMGRGATGKSTFLNVVSALFGSYGQHAAAETFMQHRVERPTNDLAAMKGARLVTVTETEEHRKLAPALMKALTGGDPVTARHLYAANQTYVPQFTIWLATNHDPKITDTSDAMWRRIRKIPFDVVIPEAERDGDLTKKLIAELPGILTWATSGAQAWYENGLPKASAVRAATETYRAEQDSVAGFLADRCEIGPQYTETVAALHEAYLAFCKDNGDREPLPKNPFSIRLSEKDGVEDRRTTKARLKDGIHLRDSDPMTHDAP